MTTPIVQSITDELLDELEKSAANDLESHRMNREGRTMAFTVASIIVRLRAAEADAKRLEFYVRECCVMECMNGSSSPVVYRLYWPHEGEHQDAWYPTERDAIDAAMERHPEREGAA